MSRLAEIAEHTVKEMQLFWELAVTPDIEEHVRAAMLAYPKQTAELRDLEKCLEVEDQLGSYASLSARYLNVFKDVVKRAVIDVRFGRARGK